MNDTVSIPLAIPVSINWRGIAWFLAICLGLTWSIEITALACGIRFAERTIATTILFALVMFIFTFGEEFGWTGYLLPSLLPLGRWKAVVIYGVIWGLWHAPIIAGGYNYPGHPKAGIIFMCASTTSLGLIQCSLLLRYRSVLLTSFLQATINAHTRGVWPLLMTGVTPLLGGPLGLLGTLVIGIVGSWLLGRTKERQSQ